LFLSATLVPGKSGADDRLKVRSACLPSEPLGSAARIGDQHRRIARPPGSLAPGYRAPANRLGHLDYFAYRMTAPCPKVEGHARALGAKMLERAQMSLG
jgi:hypothetical protein